jgi:transposase
LSKVGRPTKLTPEVTEAFLKALRVGNYLETAAAFAGIAKQTVYDWLRRGAREESRELIEFSDAVKKAQAQAEARDVAIIASAATRQWQAAAWRLERMHSDRYAQRSRVEQKVAHSFEDMTDEQVDERFQAIMDKAVETKS